MQGLNYHIKFDSQSLDHLTTSFLLVVSVEKYVLDISEGKHNMDNQTGYQTWISNRTG